MEYESTGVICHVAEDFCRVYYKVNESAWESHVTKLNFFTFGIRCNGSLTNIVDIGQDVNLSYRFGADRRPLVVAVWLGDKPEVVTRETSRAIFDQKGVVVQSDNVTMIVKNNDLTVVVYRDVVFINGRPLGEFCAVNVGDILSYDAIPSEFVHPTGASFQATCAWSGLRKPRLVDRFRLNVCDEDSEIVEYTELENVLGTVEVIPNDVLAFVSVKAEFHVGKVMLFRKSLDLECSSLKEILEVGDMLNMNLRFASLQPTCEMWFVVKASKVSYSVVQPVVIKEERTAYSFSGNSAEVVTRSDDEEAELIVKEEFEPETEEMVEEEMAAEGLVEETANVLPTRSNYKRVPFKKSWPSDDVPLLLHCPCIVTVKRHKSEECVKIKHAFGSLFVSTSDPIANAISKSCNFKVLKGSTGEGFVFDAESENSGELRVKRIWHVPGPPPFETLIRSRLNYAGAAPLRKDLIYVGKIESLPFADCAIAIVNNIPVLVQLCSLVTEEDLNLKFCTINMFLNVGVTVFVTVRRGRFELDGQEYFRAEKVWKVIKTVNDTSFDENKGIITWFSLWGLKEYFKNGHLEKVQGRYYVKRVSKKTLRRIEVDSSSFFVDCSSILPSKLNDLVGHPVFYHAKSENRNYVITCAWIGSTPSPVTLLKTRLSVPPGLVDPEKYYEATVEDFPIPTHAICRIGFIPVLLPLIQYRNGETFTGVVEKDLKIGARIFARVKEEKIDNDTYLEVVDSTQRTFYSESVVVNFTGRVLKIPNPVGVIVMSEKVKVSFELCCIVASRSTTFDNLWSWFEFVEKKLEVGTKVRLLAFENAVLDVAYRAIEVYIDDES